MSNLIDAWQVTQQGLQHLNLVKRPRPSPQRGEILVRLKAAALNYRDLMVARGQYFGERQPIVPVADGVGEVILTGEGVTRFRVGDRVSGTYFPDWLEGAITPAKVNRSWGAGTLDGVLADSFILTEAAAVNVPAHLTDAEAATLPCAGVTAWNALFGGPVVTPGQTVLVLGTGGVSLFALQLGKLAGARAILTSSDDRKLERARQLGADAVINYRTNAAWVDEVKTLTGGNGVDLVVDTVAGAGFNQAVASVRAGGTVAVIGVLGGIEAPVSTMQIIARAVNVRGIHVGSRANFEEMNRAVALHSLRPVVDRVFGFNEAPAAYAHLASGQHFGKVVIAR